MNDILDEIDSYDDDGWWEMELWAEEIAETERLLIMAEREA